MKFLLWAEYNACIIMDSYRPHSCVSHGFPNFHMFIDELYLQLRHNSPPPRSPGPSVQPPFVCVGTTPPNIPQLPQVTTFAWFVIIIIIIIDLFIEGSLISAVYVAPSTISILRNTRPPHTETCPTSGGNPHFGVPNATSTSVSMSAAHAGVTVTLKFSFSVELNPK